MANSGLCRICQSAQFEPRFKKDGFTIDKCVRCGLTQVTNAPTAPQIRSYYDKEFFDTYYESLQKDEKTRKYEYRKFDCRLDQIERWAGRKGKLLDIGCSFGFFLDTARRRGWDVHGLEIAEYAADYARTQLGIPVTASTLCNSDFPANFFDVVTMWNVIEHLANPLETLQHVHRVLKPAGVLVLTTGNVESLVARLQRTRWRMLIPPIHLMHFSPSTITRALNACQLDLVEQTYALPYEFLLQRMRVIGLVRKLNISDKMLVYARKGQPAPAEKDRNLQATVQI
jgi:2-polyprenyl-3-methyl-5-hydroxy-6-metoxy-1,4-benzoquinol methylase